MSLANVLAQVGRPADRTRSYGPGSEHVVEIWDGAGTQAVVVIHGGFWAARYDRAHIRPLCAALAERGFLTIALEYHRVGQRPGGWPGTFDDIAAALDALPSLTDGLVDGSNTVLVGHSAGGHLALWAASRDRLPEHAPGAGTRLCTPKGVVSLAGVCDLGTAYRLDLDGGAVARLLGGSPEEVPERYDIADPMRLLPVATRCVLVHGDRDDRVPLLISSRYRDAAVATGSDVRLATLADTGHFELIDPTTAAFEVLLGAIDTGFGD
jgi:acetyl esterase/lipase